MIETLESVSVGRIVLQLVVPIALAGAVTTVAAVLYRFHARDQLPDGPTLIVGLGAVAIYLNTRLALVEYIGDGSDPFAFTEMWMNVIAFTGAGFASFAGRHVGETSEFSDRLRERTRQATDLSPLVRSTGRFISITVPPEIGDIEGYDTLSDEKKTTLEGTELLFPRGLTVDELRTQFTARLQREHGVGYVDVDLDSDGTIRYLALGKRAVGIGPTLPQGAHAVAFRADPPYSASPGDTIQIWRTDTGPTRIGTGELRASVGSVVTAVTNEQVARQIDPTAQYRLLTLPVDTHPEKEFAAMLRRADETMGIVEIGAESILVGSPVGALSVTVIAIRSSDGEVTTLPRRRTVLSVGDVVFALGRPESLRTLEESANDGNHESGHPASDADRIHPASTDDD